MRLVVIGAVLPSLSLGDEIDPAWRHPVHSETAEAILPSVLAEYDDRGTGLEVLSNLPNAVQFALPNALLRLRDRHRFGGKSVDPDLIDAAMVQLLRHSTIPNVRSRAATNLSKSEHDEALAALIDALSDTSPNVRLSACQSLMFREDKQAVEGIMKLLDDQDSEVRSTAVRALGWLEAREALPRIRELHAAQVPGKESMFFVDAFARLGDDRMAIRSAESFLSSENSKQRYFVINTRYFVVEALGRVESKEMVPLLIRALPIEMAAELEARELRSVHRDESRFPALIETATESAPPIDDLPLRTYIEIVSQLQKRTGQEFGNDAAAWMKWWQEDHGDYGVEKDDAQPPEGFADLARRFQAAVADQPMAAERRRLNAAHDPRAGYNVAITYIKDPDDPMKGEETWSETIGGIRIRLIATKEQRVGAPIVLVLMIQHTRGGEAAAPHFFPVAAPASGKPRRFDGEEYHSDQHGIRELLFFQPNAVETAVVAIVPAEADPDVRTPAQGGWARHVIDADPALETGTYRFQASYSPTGLSPVAIENQLGRYNEEDYKIWHGKRLTTPPIEVRIVPRS